MHPRASALEGLVFIAYLLVALFILRTIAVKYPDSAVGKALIYIAG